MRRDPFAKHDLSRNDFLGGKARIWQPKTGYRAGVDPVLLAASIDAQPGQTVLELGCGAAPGLCCLGARVPGLHLAGLEIQPAYADLARHNLSENALQGQIWVGDITAPPPEFRQLSFDHVFANPPFFKPDTRAAATDAGRELARAGPVDLSDWVALAAKRLKPRGFATFIQKAERLPELMAAFYEHFGALELLPLSPRQGKPPNLVLLRGRKDGRAPFCLHPGRSLHEGNRHPGDFEHYQEWALGVLRNGESLTFR